MPERYLCLKCWSNFAQSDALFTCPACQLEPFSDRTGDGIRPVSQLKRGWFDRFFSGASGLQCQWHPEAELKLFCPVCKGAVRSSLRQRDDRPSGIGLVGSSQSGKTTLLVMMMQEFFREKGHHDRGIGLFPLADTDTRFQKLSHRLLKRRLVLHPTSLAETDQASFAWEVLVESGRGKRSQSLRTISLHDRGGEIWERLGEEESRILDRYLRSLGTVALLVDGAEVTADLDLVGGRDLTEAEASGPGVSDNTVLNELRDRLGDRTKDLRLAIVVSKLDLLWDRDGCRDLRDDDRAKRKHTLRRVLAESGRLSFLLAAEASFNSTELFGVSSLGFDPGPPDPAGETRLPGPPEPFGVDDLLKWLLGIR